MSGSIKMLRRHGHTFKSQTEIVELLKQMPLGFFKEVLPLKGYALKNPDVTDEVLIGKWIKIIQKLISDIDYESSELSNYNDMTSSDSIFSCMREDYNYILTQQRKRMKKLRDIVSAAIRYQELIYN